MRRFGSLTVLVLLAFPSIVLAQDDTAKQVAEGFIEALSARDHERMADSFSPDAKGQILVPPGFTEATGGTGVGEQFRRLFGGASSFEIVESEIEPVGTKLHLFYKFRVVFDGQEYHGEQHVYVVLEDGFIVSFDMLCSGIFPVEQ
jgi:hypothetical protein